MREERFIDSAIKKALGRQGPGTASSCPDENQLAAYLERGLSDQERSRLENHASECASCQELLALSMKTAQDEPLPAAQMGFSRERRQLLHFSVPLAAIAVLVLGVAMATLLLLTREFSKPERTEIAQQMPPAGTPESREMRRTAPESSTVPVEPVKPSSPSLPPAQASRMRGAADQMAPAKDKEVQAQEQPITADYMHVPETEGKLSKADRIASNEAVHKPAVWKGRSETEAAGGVVGGVVGGVLPPPRPAEETAAREAAPQSAAVALDSGAAKTEALSPTARQAMKSQRASLSMAAAPAAESRPREVIRRMAADEKAEKHRDSRTRVISIGERTFELNGGFWVDLKCVRNPDAELIECKQGLAGFDEVLKTVPGLAELRRDGLPILLEWNGKICLIR